MLKKFFIVLISLVLISTLAIWSYVGFIYLSKKIAESNRYHPLFSEQNTDSSQNQIPLYIKSTDYTDGNQVLELSGVVKKTTITKEGLSNINLTSIYNNKKVNILINLGDNKNFNFLGLNLVRNRTIGLQSTWKITPLAEITPLIKLNDQIIVFIPLALKNDTSVQCESQCQLRRSELSQAIVKNLKFLTNLKSNTPIPGDLIIGPVNQLVVGVN